MEARIHKQALPEMHAGVPFEAAVDVWYKVLTDIEDMNLVETPFCGVGGGTAGILKFFDQIIRPSV